MAGKIEVIIGTYEEFLLGYKVEIKENGQLGLTQSFADKSHAGAIKCVATKGKWVATGATDDRIFVYDMQSRKQAQILLSHEGTVNYLSFTPDETHLLSVGEDGNMFATRLGSWSTEAHWKKAHSGARITHICCHPSGKLALSLGTDRGLRTWNLVKGRVAYKTNLKSRNSLGLAPDCLSWSPTGEYFSLTGQRAVELWSIKTADVLVSKKTTSKPVSLAWVADDACVVGLEDGKLMWISLKDEDEEAPLVEAHAGRVKAVAYHNNSLVTVSSSGEIKLWQVIQKQKALKELAVANIGCRPTCVTILDLEQFGKNYELSNTITETKEVTKPKINNARKQERGIVTIEYENEDENVDDDIDSDSESPQGTDDEDELQPDDTDQEEEEENEDGAKGGSKGKEAQNSPQKRKHKPNDSVKGAKQMKQSPVQMRKVPEKSQQQSKPKLNRKEKNRKGK